MSEAFAPEIDVRPVAPDTVARPATAHPPRRLGARDATHAGWVLAPGEELVWTGRPSAIGMASRAFRLPIVAAYFGALIAWGLVELALGRAGVGAIVMPFATGLLTCGALFGSALILARTTTYLVTTDRVVMRYGAALSRSLSIPFRQIAALRIAVARGGRGDIALALKPGTRIPYLKLWPHVRPWHLGRPEPMLCAIPDAAVTATRLARRLEMNRNPTTIRS